MSVSFIQAYELEDMAQWDLYIGTHFEGEITEMRENNPLVQFEGLKVGFHVDLMDFEEGAGNETLCLDLGVFDSFDLALKAASDHLLRKAKSA